MQRVMTREVSKQYFMEGIFHMLLFWETGGRADGYVKLYKGRIQSDQGT